MPVEYVTGHCGFYGRDFFVDKRVLIPRVEEEDFIRLALTYLPSSFNLHPSTFSFADLGTGSGILGITLCKELLALGVQPIVYLSDISKDALKVTKRNVARLLQEEDLPRVNILKSDLFDNYPPDLKFDLIVANLPYIPSDRIPKLHSSVRDFEPHLALDGGADGLKLINKCVQRLPSRLKPRGTAILEIDETHRLSNFPKIKNLTYQLEKDQFGKVRFLVVQFVP